MKSYGVRELRQSASQILDEVKQGEIVEITEWGESIARITSTKKSRWDDLISTGLITPAKPGWHSKVKKHKLKGNKTTTEILSELRDEER